MYLLHMNRHHYLLTRRTRAPSSFLVHIVNLLPMAYIKSANSAFQFLFKPRLHVSLSRYVDPLFCDKFRLDHVIEGVDLSQVWNHRYEGGSYAS